MKVDLKKKEEEEEDSVDIFGSTTKGAVLLLTLEALFIREISEHTRYKRSRGTDNQTLILLFFINLFFNLRTYN